MSWPFGRRPAKVAAEAPGSDRRIAVVKCAGSPAGRPEAFLRPPRERPTGNGKAQGAA
jgi:hypothetical protein